MVYPTDSNTGFGRPSILQARMEALFMICPKRMVASVGINFASQAATHLAGAQPEV